MNDTENSPIHFSDDRKQRNKIIFQSESDNLNLNLPDYAEKYFLNQSFSSEENMVEKMILMNQFSQDDIHLDEKKFAEFFDENKSNVLLPLFGTPVSCGFASAADDYIENYLSLDSHLIKNPTSTFFVRATGDCMKETIHPGDLLVVDRSLEATKDKIVLAIFNGEFTVKRLVIENRKIILRPDNPLFNDLVIHSPDDFQVWGVVTYIIHKA